MWDKVRLTGYVTTALTGAAALAAFAGYATFDPSTGLVDVAPFNIYVAAPLIAGPLAASVAAVALVFGWGSKKVNP